MPINIDREHSFQKRPNSVKLFGKIVEFENKVHGIAGKRAVQVARKKFCIKRIQGERVIRLIRTQHTRYL